VDGLMHALDEPRRPQTIELEVALSGRLDDQRLRHAVAAAAGRHPMARARMLPAQPFDAGFSWEIAGTLPRDPVEVRTITSPIELDRVRNAFYSRHIDVEGGPPFGLLVVHEDGDGDRVMLSVNHSAFDGVGSLRLLQSISRCYIGEADPLPDLDALEARALLDAGDLQRGRRGPAPARGRPGPARGAPAARPPTFLRQRPARLASISSKTAEGFGILHLELDSSSAAAHGDATVNDVLLAALHMAIETWNRSKGAPCERVTLMMPVNQRPGAWRGEVVANLVLPASIESTRADRSRATGLVRAIAAQTRHIKQHGVDGTPNPVPRRTPVVLRRLLPHLIDVGADQMADTAVLSNLGRVEDPPWFGQSGRGLWFGPPPRRPVILTVGAATVDSRLWISLRWCNGSFSEPAARDFAETLVGSLGLLADAFSQDA